MSHNDKVKILVVDLEPTPYKFDLWNAFAEDPRVHKLHVFFSRPSSSVRNGHKFEKLPDAHFRYTVCQDVRMLSIITASTYLIKEILTLRPRIIVISGYVDPLPLLALSICLIGKIRCGFYVDMVNYRLLQANNKWLNPKFLLKALATRIFKLSKTLMLTCGAPGASSLRAWGFRSEVCVDFPYVVDRRRLLASVSLPNNRAILNDIESEKIIILFTGRMIERKGLKTLLDSAVNLIELDKWVLWIEGIGDLLKSYIKYSEDLGLATRCRFLGASEEPLHNWYLNNAAIICVPSTHDPWGIVVDEGMQLGKAVIASNRVGSAVDRIDSGRDGFIFESGDHLDLCRKLRMLILDRDLRKRIGDEAKKKSEKYKPSRNLDNLLHALGS